MHQAYRNTWRELLFEKIPENYLYSESLPPGASREDNEFGTDQLRLENNRHYVIPWMDTLVKLQDARILELGCGTGALTIPLAEQQCKLTAVDIGDDVIALAKARCLAYGLQELELSSIQSLQDLKRWSAEKFSLIIFSASMEHMTLDERLEGLKMDWDMLAPGGAICVLEAPNRLWYKDEHTSRLPFFHWLPDDLARPYAAMSPRTGFAREQHNDPVAFYRLGRGVSYHEFELALAPLQQLHVPESMGAFNRRRNFLLQMRWLFSQDRKYARFLSQVQPNLHEAFRQINLNLMIFKKG